MVGNGGIATELVYEIENCKLIWCIRDEHISHIFLDSLAAKFLINKLNESKRDGDQPQPPSKRIKYTITSKKKGTI